MPEHFHVLITLGTGMSVEKAAQFVKGGFAFRAGRELGFDAPVWQKGFSEIRVQQPEAFSRIREYVHANPVKRFLAKVDAEYPYSSAHPGFELDVAPERLKAHLESVAGGIAKAMP
jgi:putative transposase